MTAKLSAYCLACKEQHSQCWMQDYLERCEKRGKDPLASKTGGILCAKCFWRALIEMDDEPEDAERAAGRLAR